ncbi:kinase-like protein [Pyrenochaeta sp. DS3sAY3a]|nr:kinase-like protein [Pyrenochaeta sp. DS3sAY3a]
MSMFRKPGEDSSSSSEESYENDQDENSVSHQDSVLSRINTLDSAASSGPAVQRPAPLSVRQNSAQNVRDLMLHALLEERTIRQTADQLGKDVSDPEVQRLGKETYRQIAQQISHNVDDTYASDEMHSHRATANAGISNLTKSNLSRLAIIPEGSSQALIARPIIKPHVDIPPQPSLGFDVLSGIAAPLQLHLHGYPGLQTDRYLREFSDSSIVGKGGYGKVFKAKHKLDGSFYAVKRIPVSAAKLARIQEHGPQELEAMLEEVRSLARFDHNNIIRYHNAWLEFTTTPADSPAVLSTTPLRTDRLLEGASAFSVATVDSDVLPTRFSSLSIGDPFGRSDQSYGDGIVFETSDTGMGTEESKDESDHMSYKDKLRAFKSKVRRGSQASQATIATMSSTKSRMSAVEDVDEDEEVEMIPRSHMPYSQDPTSGMSESMLSDSDIPGHLIPVHSPGPTLMLNVQMSLCESNLANFLSSEGSSSAGDSGCHHCFHPCISLELLNSIVSGVEYLHAQNVVHRDLKPANIFLSLSTARHPPYGSVDMSTCSSCEKQECLHVTPRIGDFGLVAALGDKCAGENAWTKPVGTEFYRPQTSSGVNEKLDVFALGVIGFEMLQKFGTKMERIAALTELRRGRFPEDFASGCGLAGDEVQQFISAMLHLDEHKRLSCEEVKKGIAEQLHSLKR